MGPALRGPGDLHPEVRITEPDTVRGVVLILHGGRVHSYEPARWDLLSVRRMVPIARAIAEDIDDVAVWQLRFTHRGWNGHGSPIADAEWALAEIEARHGPVPVVLVGHSMGGRTAMRVAGHRHVVGVVGLAPWLPDGEPHEQLAGRRIVVVHGRLDRWVPVSLSRQFLERARTVAADVRFFPLGGAGHWMFSRPWLWHRLTLDGVRELLA